MNIILNILKNVLGFGNGASVANNISGALNYAALIPVATWIWFNKADEIIFQIILNYKGKLETFNIFQTTIGGLAIIVGAIFIYLEFLRRSSNSTQRIYPTIGIKPGP